MKRYIKCTDTTYDAEVLEFTVVYWLVDNSNIAASVDFPAGKFENRQIIQDIKSDYQAFIDTIRDLMMSKNFYEMENHMSDSGSIYILFCYDNDYDNQAVECVFHMRISDHEPPAWDGDNKKQNAKSRMKNSVTKIVNKDYRWLNARMEQADKEYAEEIAKAKKDKRYMPEHDYETMPVIMSYVTYKNEDYYTMLDLLHAIQSELQTLRRKNPPSV